MKKYQKDLVDILTRVSTTKSTMLTAKDLSILVPYMIIVAKNAKSPLYGTIINLGKTNDLLTLSNTIIRGIKDKNTKIVKLFDDIIQDLIIKKMAEAFEQRYQQGINECCTMSL